MNLLICGIKGRIGKLMKELGLEDSYFTSIESFNNRLCRDDWDLLIDFSNPDALDDILEYSLEKNIPLVIGTTGYNEEQFNKIIESSKKIPILYSSNMSLGMNLMFSLVENVASILKDSVDIELLESHHNRKIDSPSGSLVTILESIEKGLGEARKHQYGRLGLSPRQKGEIGIHSIRAGNIVGYHEANFINDLEGLKISHEAYDRSVFAKGALACGKFIVGKEANLYTMKDVLGI